ncbi:hypothetical protein C491_08353 [Natronococcus amylolyticus DSM 10524]|uniref:Metal dependent phosphohydrolase n=1 Tax=Natronococcus amylolyticus DSM 10524 TaxID=1227497 RepID=L9XAZ8_9EURY|nr:hypothetical protein [Natronococcus amylolyticus]ELY58817.1 hypothetical protein C491_08353 [Natronococcus amylolyticus DSM 10524]
MADSNEGFAGSVNPSRLEDDVAALARALRAAEEPDDELRRRAESVAGELQDLLAKANGGHASIDTRTGGTITPLAPEPERIELADVAHALSNLSRFAGQAKCFYSVARHSVHVSREVEARDGGQAAQRWGLLHDASEAYLSDVPAPVKRSLPGYTAAERRLQTAVRDAVGLELTAEDERLVDVVDGAIGRYELAVHFPSERREKPQLEVAPADIDPDTEPKTLFLERARELNLE